MILWPKINEDTVLFYSVRQTVFKLSEVILIHYYQVVQINDLYNYLSRPQLAFNIHERSCKEKKTKQRKEREEEYVHVNCVTIVSRNKFKNDVEYLFIKNNTHEKTKQFICIAKPQRHPFDISIKLVTFQTLQILPASELTS